MLRPCSWRQFQRPQNCRAHVALCSRGRFKGIVSWCGEAVASSRGLSGPAALRWEQELVDSVSYTHLRAHETSAHL
eukprot:1678090-Alexandrium_andersonii.AAC.1